MIKMTPKQKQIAIFVGIGAVTIGYLIYARKKNQEEATAVLQYINSLPSQVDLSEATKQGMDAVRGTKIDFNKLAIGTLKGSYTNPKMRNAVSKTVVDLYSAMKGSDTDTKAFYGALFNVKNKNTLAFIDKIYKAMFKEGLFEAMKGESKLNSVYYSVFSDKTKYDLAIPFLSDGKWSPVLSTYFNNLPIY